MSNGSISASQNITGSLNNTSNVRFTLPVASKDTLGGIKVGDNLFIDEDGTLNSTAKEVDLSGYATKNDIPTKTSDLTNDSNFITSIPSEYVTDTELNEKGYLTEHQDISNLATKDEVESVINSAIGVVLAGEY